MTLRIKLRVNTDSARITQQHLSDDAECYKNENKLFVKRKVKHKYSI